jgi:hypothetical protein
MKQTVDMAYRKGKLGVRVHEALRKTIFRDALFSGEQSDFVDGLTRETLLAELEKARRRLYPSRAYPSSIESLLLRTPNCGYKTVGEILKWLGIRSRRAPHTCVCRHCGRRLLTPLTMKRTS